MNIKVSGSFKKHTIRAIAAIVAFIIVYILLVSVAIGITVASVYLAFWIISLHPSTLTILLGVGLASLGVLIFIFLVKFIFKEHKTDTIYFIELRKEEQPRVFALIEDIVVQTDTKFPKKIYITPEVNASVFYNSSFWSLFFPMRKNLQIGLGLTNAVTEEEFKAILAHEFGHFSQKSMKVGSYTYYVNQVIFNMLHDNNTYSNVVSGWASVHGIFAVFVSLAVQIIQGIQFLLSKMYRLVNITYMGLSREMEFFADEVAANVAGSKPLIDSLLRLDMANVAYNSVLNYYDEKYNDGIKSANIYKEQAFVMKLIGKENNLPEENGFPLVSLIDLSKYNKSKLNINDQWASHPSTKDRVTALAKLNLPIPYNSTKPAIDLFDNKENLEKFVTQHLFNQVSYNKETALNNFETFAKEYEENFNKRVFDKFYNNYYDNKNPESFKNDIPNGEKIDISEELFSDKKVDLVYQLSSLEQDKETLKLIAEKKTEVRTFDYDGIKYREADASELLGKVESDIEKCKENILINDKAIYDYFGYSKYLVVY